MIKEKFLNFRFIPYMLLVAIVGILLVSLLDLVYGIIFCLALFCGLLICLSFIKFHKYVLRILLFLIISVTVVASCGVQCKDAQEYKPVVFDANVVGCVNSESEFSEIEEGVYICNLILTDAKYYTATNYANIDGKVSIGVTLPQGVNVKVGDIVTIRGQLNPSRFIVRDSISVNNYLDGVKYTLTDCTFVEKSGFNLSWRECVATRAKFALDKYVPGGEIIYSMMFGNTKGLESSFLNSSRKIGIAHLFAVSGLHLGIVASIFTFVCKKLKINKKIEYFITLSLSLAYSLLVGFGPSVARAFLMLTIYKTGKLFGFRHCGISSLSLSGIIILIVSPLTLFSLSFQLSFMAIIGILFFSKPLERVIKTRFKKFNTFVALNLSVNFALLPFMLHYFGRISLLFLLANLIIIPIVTAIFPVVFIFVLLSAITPQIAYAILPFGYVMKFVELLSNVIASVPFLSVSFKATPLIIVLYVALLVVISTYSLLKSKAKAIIASVLCVVVLGVSVVQGCGIIDSSCKVETVCSSKYYDYVMLDIKNEHYLIVNGSLNKQLVVVVSSYMAERSIDRLDGLVKTSFENNELDTLHYFKNALNVKSLITYDKNNYLQDIFANEIYFSKNVGKYLIAPINKSVLKVSGNNSELMFFDGKFEMDFNNYPTKIDLLYCLGDFDCVKDLLPQYLVSNVAVSKDIAYSINSYFTFVLKGGKIKII